MSQKIKFNVVYATGSDDDFSSSALESHGPSVKGWRSERFCIYPQEIVVQLPSAIRLRKLQILSHQYLVTRKVELFIGSCRPGTSPSFQTATFNRLGYISFEPNEKTSFKARELKSVHLDCEGVFIKLVCHKNHVNNLNIFNQVGIVAVNVLGDFLPSDGPQSYRDITGGRAVVSDNAGVLGNINKSNTAGLVDDITFGMYQDPEVAKVIQQLERKKHLAIEEEKYSFAKRLKQAISDLYQVGEKLGRLDREKKAAVAEENYDVAQAKKIQADEIRVVVFEELNIRNLLQEDRLDDVPNVLVRSPPHQLPSMGHQEPPPPVQQAVPPAQQAPPPPQPSPPIRAPPSPVESQPRVPTRGSDRPIPTLAKQNDNSGSGGGGGEEESVPAGDQNGPDEQSMKAAHDLTQAVEMFTHPTVACLFCKQFALRERGLTEIGSVLDTLDTSSPTYSARGLVQVFKQAFTDPVFNNLSQTVEMLKSLLGGKNVTLPRGHMTDVVNHTFPVLLKRVGENPRVREAVEGLFLDLSDIPALSPSLASLSVSVCKEKNPKVLTGRLMLLEKMVEKIGATEDGSYSEDTVMKFVAPTLSNTSRDVRDTAIRITIAMYREVGDPVRRYLPKDEPQLRKKQLIWKKIFESFDEIDGKPVNKPSEPSAEDKKAQQVAALKAELASLRELAANANVEIDEELKPGNEHMKMKKGKKKKGPPPPAAAAPPPPIQEAADDDPTDEQLLQTCMFCSEQNDEFTPETLDVHFWRACPMLSRCGHCSQVVEIAGITTHLLTECSAQGKFEQCKKCQLARPKKGSHTCSAAPKRGESLCPLCTESVRDGEDGWREHLMGPKGCRKNPRKNGQ
eukprot:sb/3462039/